MILRKESPDVKFDVPYEFYPPLYKANSNLAPKASSQREGATFVPQLEKAIETFMRSNPRLINPVGEFMTALQRSPDRLTAVQGEGGAAYKCLRINLKGSFEDNAFHRLPKDIQNQALNNENFPLSVSGNLDKATISVKINSQDTPAELEQQQKDTLNLIHQFEEANLPPLTTEEEGDMKKYLSILFPRN
jgi:hypothetical protein